LDRARRIGYKVIRVLKTDGNIWGQPASVSVAQDGAMMVTVDVSGTIWRVGHAAN
jgi:glucose/arabinose dehydrogenase